MSVRKTFFWLHLIAGLIAGVVIAIMSFTGTVLAFEKQLVAWAERDVRRVELPAAGDGGTPVRLSVDELNRRFREAQPDIRPTGLVVSADPAAAVVFSVGRDTAYYAHPYTGEIRQPATTRMHDFMHLMTDWHRWLAMTGESRATGKAITGACNAAFLFLALSGLYLWWPRQWTARVLRPSLWFTGATGKARDWNWHNVIGFWSLPVLVVLTASGMVISYRWASNLVYTAVGETPPVQAGPGAPPAAAPGPATAVAGAPTPAPSRPSPDTRPAGYDALLASAQQAVPAWETISFRLGGGPQRGGGGAPAARENTPAREGPPRAETAPVPAASGPATTAPGSDARNASAPRPTGGEGGRRAPQPVTVTVKESGTWPRTATTTLTLDPFTGAVLKREGFADLTTGRQARSWLRFLHTGEALGWAGQFIAGLASLGGVVLTYTGFALAWRRFFPGKKTSRLRAVPGDLTGPELSRRSLP